MGSFNRNKPVYSEKIDLAVSSKKVESGRRGILFEWCVKEKTKDQTRRSNSQIKNRKEELTRCIRCHGRLPYAKGSTKGEKGTSCRFMTHGIGQSAELECGHAASRDFYGPYWESCIFVDDHHILFIYVRTLHIPIFQNLSTIVSRG